MSMHYHENFSEALPDPKRVTEEKKKLEDVTEQQPQSPQPYRPPEQFNPRVEEKTEKNPFNSFNIKKEGTSSAPSNTKKFSFL